MALNRIAIPPDAARDKKARELAKTVYLWPVETLKQDWGAFKRGDSFLVTPNGWRVNTVACECPDYQQAGNICKHVRAIVMADAQKVAKPAKRYEDLAPTCRVVACDDDPEPREDFCWRHMLVDAF